MSNHNTTLKSKNKVLTLEELHIDEENRAHINQLIEEFTYIDALKNLNIPVDNKILLHGHTGCGKTATAHAIGAALNKDVIVLNLGGFISSRLGETAKNLSELFRKASNDNAILFIDEFDFIGKIRDYDEKDSGEMKRLVNTLIQQIDHLADNAILICATNHLEIIDSALLRRFQIRLKYELPNDEQLNVYYSSLLVNFPENINEINRTYGISYAEAKDIVFQQVKANIIEIEKQKKHLVLTYGILNLESVQMKIYGKELKSSSDVLNGYKLNSVELKDANLIEDTGTNTIQIARNTKDENDTIEAYVFEITGEELMKTDNYLFTNFKRVSETSQKGLNVWVYVSKK